MDPIARTARWTAAARARESRRADRLFDDPLADRLAGSEGYHVLDSDPHGPGENPYIAIRTRFFDDWLEEVTGRGIRQVVLVAAGMDSRAYRLRWPPGVRLWELDRQELLELKERLLAGSPGPTACERRLVPVDLGVDGWPRRLEAAGFEAGAPAAWLAEGLLQYLPEAAARSLLRTMASTAAAGSRLAADLVSTNLLRSPWMEDYLGWLDGLGSRWVFGTNEPEQVLEAAGWRDVRVRQPGEPGAGEGRWGWPVAPRHLPGYPRSFFATAVR